MILLQLGTLYRVDFIQNGNHLWIILEVGEWTVLEVDSSDVSKATNRFTTRATRLNAYDYTSGYEFKAIRRTPNALFLGKRV